MVGEAGAFPGDDFGIEDWDWEEGDRRFAASRSKPPEGERGLAGARPPKPFTRWTADTEQAFLLALRMSGQVRKAAEEIGRSLGAAYKRRERDPGFALAWDMAVAEQQAAWIAERREQLGEDVDDAGGGRLMPGRERVDGWDARKRHLFLRSLARGKDVRAACAAAGISDTAAYALKGRSPPFAKAWAKALASDMPSVLDAARARAVDGWDEPIVHGGQVIGQRRRYSDGLMRDLLRHELDAKRAAPDPNAGRSTEAELNEALMKNLALLDERLRREEAERREAEWGRARRTWGEWGRIAAGEAIAEPPPPPDADEALDLDEDELEAWS